MEEYESAIAPLKQALFKQLLTPLAASSSSDAAHILEVGMGTGEMMTLSSRKTAHHNHCGPHNEVCRSFRPGCVSCAQLSNS